MVRVRSMLVGVLATLATACSEATGPSGHVQPITELPRDLSTAEQALIHAGNTFALDLLRRVHTATPDSTAFMSPLSASMALGMAMNGAAGATRTQMEDMLGFSGLTADDINASYRGLIELLRGLDPRVDMRVANAIFHRNSFHMEAAFLDVVRTYFDARIDGLDFNDPAAADHINAWVREATEDRIDKMVEPPIDPMTMAFLMNAIYFKGDWTKQFEADDTYSGPFHLDGGGTQTVRFMTKEDTLGYRSSTAWHAAELPYGGGAWVMTVAVPREGQGLDALVADLETILDPAADWPDLVMKVHLPRFELEWERGLNDDLKALGMVDAFDPGLADFTPMSLDAGLYVKTVKQKTFLRVDEEGTEAAAVTSIEMGVTSCCSGPLELRADRPFLLAIRERLSGAVLFAGLIVQAPEE